MPDTHTKDGFLIRGAEMTRLETFVDAAFAFAVTLLVVDGSDAIPASYEEFGLASTLVPLGSVLLALSVSDVWLFTAGIFYGVFGIVMPAIRIRRRRARRVQFAES